MTPVVELKITTISGISNYVLFLKIIGSFGLKKSLKISEGYSEVVHRRRTDNTMGKRKETKAQTIIYKTLHRKLSIEHI